MIGPAGYGAGPRQSEPDAPAIHHTVGAYPDGSTKQNGVAHALLAGHIDYNVTLRPGRALFVDGICVYPGFMSPAALALAVAKVATLKPIDHDTRPYH